MPYLQYLDFVRDLLDKLHIHTTIMEEQIPEKVDLGLRGLLYDDTIYERFLTHSLHEIPDNTIYAFRDEYLCSYIILKIPSEIKSQYFFVGPYLQQLPPDEFIEQKTTSFHLSEEQLVQIKMYYHNLPLISDDSHVIAIVTTLGKMIWGTDESFTFENLPYLFSDQIDMSKIPLSYEEEEETPLFLHMLENKYAKENYLMEAVSKGQIQKLSSFNASVSNMGIEERLRDSLRNRKNYLIIFNTLLRKAAENGGVHPFHIDKLSSAFARKIENVYSIDSSVELQKEMIRKYCILVKNHSLSSYSALIGKTITLIEFDLCADLSLNSIATKLNVSPSYLSKLFHKELGMTLTDYVNDKRIKHALKLINSTDMQIQDIASNCGISNIHYFIRLFKKHLGMTPTEYRKTVLSP